MLKPASIGFSAVLAFCIPIAHADSTANKCTDGKHITYANMPCEELGLKSAGPVKDAVTVVPAIQKPKMPVSEDSKKQHYEKNDVREADDTGAGAPDDQKIKPINPLIEKMMNW